MKTKVLIVEDEILIAETHKDHLIAFGIDQIKIAQSAEEAREILLFFEPDLILMDLRLNIRFEGLDLAKEIKEISEIPIIYLTAHSDQGTIQKMLSTAPSAFLSKPVRKPELFSAVMIALNQKKSHNAENYICLGEGNFQIRFALTDFLYAKSSGNYLEIFIADRKRHILRMTMEKLQSALDSPAIMRVNRSTIVNLNQILRLKGKEIVIQEEVIKVSPGFFEEFTNRFDRTNGRVD